MGWAGKQYASVLLPASLGIDCYKNTCILYFIEYISGWSRVYDGGEYCMGNMAILVPGIVYKYSYMEY